MTSMGNIFVDTLSLHAGQSPDRKMVLGPSPYIRRRPTFLKAWIMRPLCLI